MPRFLLFDLDNTLIHSELAYERALGAIGLSSGNPDYAKARQAVKARLPRGHVSGRNRLLYLKALMDERRDYSPTTLLERMSSYESALSREAQAQWLSLGRKTLFDELGRDHRMAVVTNENLRTQLIKMRAIDPDSRHFQAVVTSEEVGVEKPDLLLFDVALDRLGARAEDCVMIGDSVEADILPALALGMKAILSTEFTRDQAYEGRTVSRLDDLRGALLQ